MIIQTGMRTDIPAFYSQWLLNRIEAGFVLVRNPYNPSQVTRYSLSPQVVDLMAFCTKNPAPMLPHLDLLRPYGQYWFVTITPYGKDIEPRVPDKEQVMEDFKRLSRAVGVDSIGWRYDPILLYGPYTPEYHIKTFAQIAEDLAGYTKTCVISFIDIYKKVARNFPEVRAVSTRQRLQVGKAFAEIAAANGMTLRGGKRPGAVWGRLLRLYDGSDLRDRPARPLKSASAQPKSAGQAVRLPVRGRHRRL